MSPDVNQNSEAKIPTAETVVDKLIIKKKAEKQVEGTAEVSQSAEGVQTEVADLMGGVEKPKETISERKGESGEKGDIKGGGQVQDDEQAQQAQQIQDSQLPSEEVMVKKVRSAINSQIAHEWKQAKKLSGQILTGGAQEYGATISRIRNLKEVLASLFTSTFSYVKDLYFKYFTPDGKRKSFDDISTD